MMQEPINESAASTGIAHSHFVDLVSLCAELISAARRLRLEIRFTVTTTHISRCAYTGEFLYNLPRARESDRPRKDDNGADLISDVLPFGALLYGQPNAASNAIGYAQHCSHSHDAVIRVYDDAGNAILTCAWHQLP